MNEEIQFKIRIPKVLANLWGNREEIGRTLLKQLVPNLGSVVLALVLFWVTSANAAPWSAPAESTTSIPLTINYQGRLADAGGIPIDNPNPGLGITFSLYDAESGGTPLWTETHANVPVSEGLFSIRLGSVNPLSIDLLNGDRWLGVQVGSDPEMTPRERLNAVPYAIQAGIALSVPEASITPANLNIDEDLDLNNQSIISLHGINTPFSLLSGRAWEFTSYGVDAGTQTALHSVFDSKQFVFTNQDDSLILSIRSNNTSGGSLNMEGNPISDVGAMVEANLQTPDELAADTIDRFSEGDVLCWGDDRLELCDQAGDPLVQAVADANGKPIVIGAEVIHVLGPVQRGDLLVASDVPGYAMVDNDPQPGSVIAQALEDFDGEQGLIRAMIRKF